VTVFQNILISLAKSLSNPPSTQNHFSLKSHHFQGKISGKSLQGMHVFLNIFFMFFLDYADFKLEFKNWGFFENG